MLATDGEIDGALQDWNGLGFSDESLGILAKRLYGKVEMEKDDRHYPNMGEMRTHKEGADHRYIVTLYKYPRMWDKGIKQHEIRHAGQAEMFFSLLDPGCEIYEGLGEDAKVGRMLDAFDAMMPKYKTGGLRGVFHKDRDERREVKMEYYSILRRRYGDGFLFRMLGEEGAGFGAGLAYNLHNDSYASNTILYETTAHDVSDVKLRGIVQRTVIPLACLITPLNAYFALTGQWGSPVQLASLIGTAAGPVSVWAANGSKKYTDHGVLKRLRKNIEGKDPYGQFLGFVGTR